MITFQEFYFKNFNESENLDEDLKKPLAVALMLALPGLVSAEDILGMMNNSGSIPEFQQKIEQSIPHFKDNLGHSEAAAINIVARTLWAEAKGEGENGLRAVASIIWNRAYHNPKNLTKICFAPKQFSCWNAVSPSTNPEYSSGKYQMKIPMDVQTNKQTKEIWEICKQIATEMVEDKFSPLSSLKDANSYARTGKVPADWKMTGNVTIGNHTFGTVPQRFYEYTVTEGDDDSSLELITKGLFQVSTFKNRNDFYTAIKKLNPTLIRKQLTPGTKVKIPKKV